MRDEAGGLQTAARLCPQQCTLPSQTLGFLVRLYKELPRALAAHPARRAAPVAEPVQGSQER